MRDGTQLKVSDPNSGDLGTFTHLSRIPADLASYAEYVNFVFITGPDVDKGFEIKFMKGIIYISNHSFACNDS